MLEVSCWPLSSDCKLGSISYLRDKREHKISAWWLCAFFGRCVNICGVCHSIFSFSLGKCGVLLVDFGCSALLANSVLISAHGICLPFALLVSYKALSCPKQIVESEYLLVTSTPNYVFKTIFILGVCL